MFYAYIKQHYHENLVLHPLLDFKDWVIVIYRRVQTHQNLKLRRFVIKTTLKREYMTLNMHELMFEHMLILLNKGLIFKDSNVYTQFSKNIEMVMDYYQRYFTQESKDVAGDLKRFFEGFVQHVTHPQLLIGVLRWLA